MFRLDKQPKLLYNHGNVIGYISDGIRVTDGRNAKMAPKNKYTRNEMVAAAVEVVRRDGIEGLTAKALAKELGVSTQPIFTCFSTMEAVHRAVRDAAEQLYTAYAAAGLNSDTPFLGVGMQFIRFARVEPQLYRLLFLTCDSERNPLDVMRHAQVPVQESLMRIYCLTADEADEYFRDMWLVVHGLATLIVTDRCPYSEGEIRVILARFSISICRSIKELPGFVSGEFDRDAAFRSVIERT